GALEVVERLLVLAQEEPAVARQAVMGDDLPFHVIALGARGAVEHGLPGAIRAGSADGGRPVLALRDIELVERGAQALPGLGVPDGQPADAHSHSKLLWDARRCESSGPGSNPCATPEARPGHVKHPCRR